MIALFTIGTLIGQIVTATPPIDGVAQPSGLERAFTSLRDALTGNLDWFFLSAGNIIVLLCLVGVVSLLPTLQRQNLRCGRRLGSRITDWGGLYAR